MSAQQAVGCPRSIPGPTHAKNKDALDWGGNSFIAYGCASNVVLVDPYSGQVPPTPPASTLRWPIDSSF